MNERSRLSLKVLEAAVLLGVLGDALLGRVVPGINVLLWTSALVAAMWALQRKHGESLSRDARRWLMPCALLFALSFAWRDSAVLKWLDAIGVLLALTLVMREAYAPGWRVAGVMEYARSTVQAAAITVIGFLPLVVKDIVWRELPGPKRWSRHALAIGRGVVIAVPLLFVFGGLLMAADAIFSRLVSNTFYFELDSLFSHIFFAIFFTWLSGGFLRGMFLRNAVAPLSTSAANSFSSLSIDAAQHVQPEKEESNQEQSTVKVENESRAAPNIPPLSIGLIETSIVLGALNVLFCSFVFVQMRYFFGGVAAVQASVGLTYAEYARRGFFELVWVAALVLPVLLIGHWLLRKDNPVNERVFRSLAGALLGMLFIIMFSAVQRMLLYVNEYGLTELRFYTTAFMAWLALMLAWFGVTVLWRGERERFAFGSLIAAFLVVTTLHALNPDALIVSTNVQRVRQGRVFDAAYAASLSHDAVPALIESLPAMRPAERATIAKHLLTDWEALPHIDWRSWNFARHNARQAVQSNESLLRQLATIEAQPVPPVIQGSQINNP